MKSGQGRPARLRQLCHVQAHYAISLRCAAAATVSIRNGRSLVASRKPLRRSERDARGIWFAKQDRFRSDWPFSYSRLCRDFPSARRSDASSMCLNPTDRSTMMEVKSGMPAIRAEVKRSLLAFTIAPLVPSVMIIILAFLGRPAEAIWSAVFVLLLSYATMLFPGAPLCYVVWRLRWNSVWAFIAIGVVCSTVAAAFVMQGPITSFLTNEKGATLRGFLMLAIVASIFGAVTGYVFWRIVRPGRPSSRTSDSRGRQ